MSQLISSDWNLTHWYVCGDTLKTIINFSSSKIPKCFDINPHICKEPMGQWKKSK